MDKKPPPSGPLSQITSGKRLTPIFGLIAGLPGVGKTTLASKAPKPVFLGLEEGTNQIDTSRFPQAQTFQEFLDQIGIVANETHPYKTIVFDTVDRIETLVWEQVCREGRVDTISDYAGGYGQGYIRASEYFRQVMSEAAALARRFHVLFCSHVMVKTFNDPKHSSGYDRYIMKIHDRSAGIVMESLDLCLFCTYKTELVKERKGRSSKDVRAITDGTRVMYTETRPAWLPAKNRFNLPFEMPMEWNDLAQAIKASYAAEPAEPPPAKPSTQEPPQPETPPTNGETK
jgi:hypothetical protein